MKNKVCPQCKAVISEKSRYCWKCGCLLKSFWAGIRKGFGIADLVIGTMFLCLILGSEGGIENNAILLLGIMAIFLIFICISLSDQESFKRGR